MKEKFNELKKRLTQWAEKNGVPAIFLCAFADACVLPLPTPVFFITLILFNFSKAYKYALWATLGSLSGSIIGYYIGNLAWLTATGDLSDFAYFVFDYIPGFTKANYLNIQLYYEKWNFWILFIASLTPIPYKFFSITAGVFDVNIVLFCSATLMSQAIKFYVLAFLATRIGFKIRQILEYDYKPIAIIATVTSVLALLVYKIM